MAWRGVTKRTLTSAWEKLWPEVVSETYFERLKPDPAVVKEIVWAWTWMKVTSMNSSRRTLGAKGATDAAHRGFAENR